ncbi:CAP domain-containing protein [Butyrivibrio sp. XPD2006]|uniref:CAP domain-containing protein n=1 Tax=Butyrivibrio sp. XPD2006 TaxID=1280668 RepID=UPI0018CB054F|nr:CAP domain-containing protein [Butyrivibrio sp. XPD2006]
MIQVISATMALCICACGRNTASNNMEFSEIRAYRDTSQLDYGTAPDIEDIIDGYYMAPDNQELIYEAFEMLNTARDDNGLSAFVWDQELATCAVIRAEEISYSFDKNHIRPNGAEWYTLYPSMLLGEDICRASGDVKKVMESWLENPADRENFLCPDFTKVAIAVYEDSKGQFYWTCEFGNDSSKKAE